MQAMEESQKQLEEMKKALSDNDTHIQLSNLERRWQVINLNTLIDFCCHSKQINDFCDCCGDAEEDNHYTLVAHHTISRTFVLVMM